MTQLNRLSLSYRTETCLASCIVNYREAPEEKEKNTPKKPLLQITAIVPQGKYHKTCDLQWMWCHLTLFIPHTSQIIIAILITRTFGRKNGYWKRTPTYFKLMSSKWPQNVDNVRYISKYDSKYVGKYAQMRIQEHAVTMYSCVSCIK